MRRCLARARTSCTTRNSEAATTSVLATSSVMRSVPRDNKATAQRGVARALQPGQGQPPLEAGSFAQRRCAQQRPRQRGAGPRTTPSSSNNKAATVASTNATPNQRVGHAGHQHHAPAPCRPRRTVTTPQALRGVLAERAAVHARGTGPPATRSTPAPAPEWQTLSAVVNTPKRNGQQRLGSQQTGHQVRGQRQLLRARQCHPGHRQHRCR